MKCIDFRTKLQAEFPEISTVIRSGDFFRVRVSPMVVYDIKAVTKTLWTDKNLEAILEFMRNRKIVRV
jgi:hypothetical protein